MAFVDWGGGLHARFPSEMFDDTTRPSPSDSTSAGFEVFGDASRPAGWGRTGLIARTRSGLAAQLARPLERNAYALALNAAVTAVLGLLYWLIAARLYTPRAVGQSAALLSAMLFLATCASLNLPAAMTHLLPRTGRTAASLVRWGYAAAATLAVAGGGAFVMVAGDISPQLAFLREESLILSAGFCAAVVLWVIFAIQDGVLTGLRKAVWVPVANGAFALAKLALLLPLATALPDFGVFAAWTIPLVVVIVVVNLAIVRRLVPDHAEGSAARAEALPRRRVLRFIGGDYVGYLFLQGSTTLLPVLVAARLGAETNAHFYVAFVLVAAVDVMALGVGASLTTEGSHDERQLAELLTRAVRLIAWLLVPAVIVFVAAAPLLLSMFGESYASSAATTLRLLALGLLAKGISILYICACRARGAVSKVVAVEASIFAVIVGLSFALLGPLGLPGVGLAWLIGQGVVGLVVLPKLRALMRQA